MSAGEDDQVADSKIFRYHGQLSAKLNAIFHNALQFYLFYRNDMKVFQSDGLKISFESQEAKKECHSRRISIFNTRAFVCGAQENLRQGIKNICIHRIFMEESKGCQVSMSHIKCFVIRLIMK